MAITIKKVTTRRELERFIRFNYLLYKNNPYSVPDLFDDMLNTFNKKKNAAFEFCEADYFPSHDTTGKTYSELVTEINKIDGVQASLVEDSTGKFRLSIKSTETGTANKITIGGDASTHFGFANVLKAQDMELTADGVNYSSSSNTVTVDGLKITATKKGGDSTINIENDTTAYRDWETDRKSTRLNSSHITRSRMPSSA